MSEWGSLKSVKTAMVLGLAVAALLSSLLFGLLGWLGIGLLGFFGLLISLRLEMQGGYAVPDLGRGDSSVNFLARQIEARERATPAQKLEQAANDAERKKWLTVVNTICIAMAVLGLIMFVRHQL